MRRVADNVTSAPGITEESSAGDVTPPATQFRTGAVNYFTKYVRVTVAKKGGPLTRLWCTSLSQIRPSMGGNILRNNNKKNSSNTQ